MFICYFFSRPFFYTKKFLAPGAYLIFFQDLFFLAPSKMLRLRRLSVTARPFGRNYGKFFEKKTLPMALRITSKDYENLYVTSYFSFHGDKNTLYVNSSKKYRPTSGKLCPRTKHSTRENSLIFTREILTSTREKKSFCARENVRVPEKICAKVGEKNKFPPRKKLKK